MREANTEFTFFDQELNLIQALIEKMMLRDDEIDDALLSDFYFTVEQFLDRLSNYNRLLSSCYNKKEVSQIAKELTLEPNNTYEGRKTNKFPEDFPRPYRSFRDSREIQLLRHVATQLYFALKTYIPKELARDLKEVQVMHLAHGGKHNLYIAANKFNIKKNELNITSYLSYFNNSKDYFKRFLLTNYLPSDYEGRLRSRRYAGKMAKRIFGESILNGNNIHDLVEAALIGQILRKSDTWKGENIRLLTIEYSKDALTVGSKSLIASNAKYDRMIFLVEVKNHSNKSRHAEEFLCDISNYLKSLYKDGIYNCIAGKKRPCMSCSGRMKVSASKYGNYPGRFWPHGITSQPPEAQISTMKLLYDSQTNVSRGIDGSFKTDYDSGSDSDDEYAYQVQRY